MFYDYISLNEDMACFNEKDKFSMGKSVEGRDIWCIKLGNGKKRIVIAAAFHGLEYLTAAFLMRFIKENKKELFEGANIYAVPMVNPDGVNIAVNGLDVNNPYHADIIKSMGTLDFKNVWQANVRGVDLNHNYNAGWSKVVTKPSPTKYGGEYPESEPETQAMVKLVKEVRPHMLIALHSQGEEIYYEFDGKCAKGAKELAKEMAQAGEYKACRPEGTAVFGGFKDWYINEFMGLGYTIEIGKGKNPLTDLDEVYKKAEKVLMCAIEGVKGGC